MEITCEDCINCKTETVNEEYNYCQWYNDYFEKKDSHNICLNFDNRKNYGGK